MQIKIRQKFCELKSAEDSWQFLRQKFPKANRLNSEDYSLVLDSSSDSARELADLVFDVTAALPSRSTVLRRRDLPTASLISR